MHLADLGRAERLDRGDHGLASVLLGGFTVGVDLVFVSIAQLDHLTKLLLCHAKPVVCHSYSFRPGAKGQREHREAHQDRRDGRIHQRSPGADGERSLEVRGGKKTVSTRKLYPGYVFIDMVLLDENKRVIEKPWYFIRDTQGIIGFVGGERPARRPG